jgi:hypothetical protein
MFEHLKDQAGLPWRHRIAYSLASGVVVLGVFLASLWLIASTVEYFESKIPVSPVRVHYDANEDGTILNEILPPSIPLSPGEEGPEKASPPL